MSHFFSVYTVPEHMAGTKQLPHTASYKLLQLLVIVTVPVPRSAGVGEGGGDSLKVLVTKVSACT